MSETDERFIDRMEHDWVHDIIPNGDDAHRLFAIARRGAEAAAEIERLRAALREIATYEIEDGCPCNACQHSAIARAALKEDGDE